MLGALGWTVWGYRSLGRSHSAWVAPAGAAPLVTTGAYAVIRHPVYAGWTATALGWGLLTRSPLGVGLAIGFGVFYDRRVRVEERLLEAVHPEYATYRRRVRRFVPVLY